VTINGVKLANYAQEDPYDTSADPAEDGIVVPLFATPTADFEHYYAGSLTARKTTRKSPSHRSASARR
jgi:hypothetical protein